MQDDEGQKGGVFPETRLSALRALQSDDPAERERSMEIIALAYWRPVYCHLRLRWRRSSDESREKCQEFFTRAIEKRTFEAFDPERGRFRAFVRTCLDRFVLNEDKAERRFKRGGLLSRVPVDVSAIEDELASASPYDPSSAEEEFERAWVRALLDSCVDALRASLEARGKRIYFEVFDRYVLRDVEPRPSYAEVARELGVAVTDVTNWLAVSRRELRRIVSDRLRQITVSEEELEHETRVVLGDAGRAQGDDEGLV